MKNLTILFVEDEIDILKNITDAISDEFKNFITAKNGIDGLKKFKKFKPDIIITDILMPKLNGLDMSLKVKEISPNTPIVILSAFSEKENLLKAIDSKVDKYLIKPIDIDELLDVVNKISRKIISDNIVVLPDGYSYNKRTKELFLNHEYIKLTKKDVLFIDTLIQNIGTFATNEALIKNVWGGKVAQTAIRTFIQRLRNKTDKNFIENVSGLGYKIRS